MKFTRDRIDPEVDTPPACAYPFRIVRPIRFAAAAVLAMILAAVLAPALAFPARHDPALCGCSPGNCKCEHSKGGAMGPHCRHDRGGSSTPTMQCASDDDLAVHDVMPFVLTAKVLPTHVAPAAGHAVHAAFPRSVELLDVLTPPS